MIARNCLLIAIIFLAFVPLLHSQGVSTQIGSRANAIGYTASALFDEWAVFNNIAGTSKLESIVAAFTYDLHPSLIGANRTAVALAIPTKIGIASTGVYRFGDDIYNEHLLTAGFSNALGLTSLGVQLNYIQYHVEDFGSKGVLSLNFGGIAELTPTLSIGAFIVNLHQPEIGDQEKLPTKLLAGVGFKLSEKVFFASEIEKELNYDPLWKMGIEYKLHKKFTARTGYNINPNKAFFGFGFNTKKITIDYAAQYSRLLSLSHQATVGFQLKRR